MEFRGGDSGITHTVALVSEVAVMMVVVEEEEEEGGGGGGSSSACSDARAHACQRGELGKQ